MSHTYTPVHPENTVTYSAGNGGQNICGLKLLCCRDPVLPPLKPIHIVGQFSAESAHVRYSIYHMVAPRVMSL